jgi:hypothetical protein
MWRRSAHAAQKSLPFKEYLPAPGLASLVGATWFASQQWLQFQTWWAHVPWLVIIVACLAFTAGTFYADLWNENSQLRRWWGDRRRVFEVIFHPASEVRDGVDLNTPYFALKFLGPIRDYAIELMLYEHIQFSIIRTPILLRRIEPANYSEGEQLKVPIAIIPRAGGGPAFWGDGAQKKSITTGSGNLVEIRAVKNSRVKQRYSVFISCGEFRAETANQFFYLQEDRYVFRQQNT